MSIKLKTPSNGSVTLSPENTASDVTLTVPAVAGEILNDASDLAAAKLTGNVAAARITDALNATGSAPIFACRAWVNFNGTGTVAIRGSGNVSSITDNGTGDYTINFTTAMEDADYSTVASCGRNTSGGGSGTGGLLTEVSGAVAPSTSAVRVDAYNFDFTRADARFVTVAIFR
jgi:hypothetical protein